MSLALPYDSVSKLCEITRFPLDLMVFDLRNNSEVFSLLESNGVHNHFV